MHPALNQARMHKALFKLNEIPRLMNGLQACRRPYVLAFKLFFVVNAVRLDGPVLYQNASLAVLLLGHAGWNLKYTPFNSYIGFSRNLACAYERYRALV